MDAFEIDCLGVDAGDVENPYEDLLSSGGVRRRGVLIDPIELLAELGTGGWICRGSNGRVCGETETDSSARSLVLLLLLTVADEVVGRVVPGHGPRFFCTPEKTHSIPAAKHLIQGPGSPSEFIGPSSHRIFLVRQVSHALVVREIGPRPPRLPISLEGWYDSKVEVEGRI